MLLLERLGSYRFPLCRVDMAVPRIAEVAVLVKLLKRRAVERYYVVLNMSVLNAMQMARRAPLWVVVSSQHGYSGNTRHSS